MKHASRFQFGIATLLLIMLGFALVLCVVRVFGYQSGLYLTPVAIGVAGYVFGSWIGWPTLTPVAGEVAVGLYVATLPLVERCGHAVKWPAGTLRLYERYASPFFDWLGIVPWFYRLHQWWWFMCEDRPVLCGSLLAWCSVLALTFGFLYDRRLRKLAPRDVCNAE